jgi:hypothetical protein
VAHLDENEVERFIGGDLTPDDRRRVVRHLLTDCRPCRAKLASLSEVLFRAEDLNEDARGVGSFSYDAALTRASTRARRYQSRYRKVRERLDQALNAGQVLHAEISPEFEALRGWPRVEALLRLSFEERYRDPQRMLLLAFAARLAAEELDPGELGHGLVADFRARAWAEVGDAGPSPEDPRFSGPSGVESRASLRALRAARAFSSSSRVEPRAVARPG